MFGGADDNAPGLRFTLFGFPILIGWSFLLIPAVLTFGSGAPLSFTLLWVAIVVVSVLVHELGHAFAARRLGSEPKISLYSLGGLTSYRPARPHTRAESIGVSFAGPAAGFTLGLAVLAFDRFADPASGTHAHDAVRLALFANLGWGALNLVPVLPLDGGNIMANLIPGDQESRYRWAARLSLVVGAVLVVVALSRDLTFVALLLGMCAVSNLGLAGSSSRQRVDGLAESFGRLRSGDVGALDDVRREVAKVPSTARRTALVSAAADTAIALGSVDAAAGFVDHFGGQVDPAIHAELAARRGQPGAVDALKQMAADTAEPLAVRALTRSLLATGRSAELVPFVRSAPEALRRLAPLREMHLIAHVGGQPAVAAQLGGLLLERHPDAEPATWYNVACSLSTAGHPDQALQVLSGAIDRGWSDLGAVDHDPDLATARAHPAFPSIRYRLASRPA